MKLLLPVIVPARVLPSASAPAAPRATGLIRFAGIRLSWNGGPRADALRVARRRQRIEDRDQASRCALKVCEKSPRALQVRRHGRRGRERDLLVEALVAAHEERLARLIGPLTIALAVGVLVPLVRDVVQRVLDLVRVERGAAEEQRGRAVQVVGARLQRQVDDAAAGAAVRRVGARGVDLELLDRVHRRRVAPIRPVPAFDAPSIRNSLLPVRLPWMVTLPLTSQARVPENPVAPKVCCVKSVPEVSCSSM